MALLTLSLPQRHHSISMVKHSPSARKGVKGRPAQIYTVRACSGETKFLKIKIKFLASLTYLRCSFWKKFVYGRCGETQKSSIYVNRVKPYLISKGCWGHFRDAQSRTLKQSNSQFHSLILCTVLTLAKHPPENPLTEFSTEQLLSRPITVARLTSNITLKHV